MISSILLCLVQATIGLTSTLHVNRDPFKYASYPIKAVLVGNVNVGKTCLFHTLCREAYQDHLPPTIGADVQNITMLATTERTLQSVTVSLWDTAGLELYRAITRSHAQGADIIIAVFEAFSLVHMHKMVAVWRESLVEMSEFRKGKVILVGAKYDLVQEQIDQGLLFTPLTDDDVKVFAQECGYDGGVVVSSLGGFQIAELKGHLEHLCGLLWEERAAVIEKRLREKAEHSDVVQEPLSSSCCFLV